MKKAEPAFRLNFFIKSNLYYELTISKFKKGVFLHPLVIYTFGFLLPKSLLNDFLVPSTIAFLL